MGRGRTNLIYITVRDYDKRNLQNGSERGSVGRVSIGFHY